MLFSAGIPLITLMVVMLLFGALLGVFLTLVLARRRAPLRRRGHRRRAAPARRRRSSRRRRSARLGLNLNLDSRSRVGSHQPAESRATACSRRRVDLARARRC